MKIDMIYSRISSPLSRMLHKWCYLASCLLLLSSFLLGGAEACWGKSARDYGIMTDDYDIQVGSELVLNCTLKNKTLRGLNRSVSSSDLTIEKGNQDYSKNIRKLDDYSIQLMIANASEDDTGIYICKIVLSEEIKPVVCGTKVNVGYPPQPVENFSCISRNYESLNCSWNIVKNNVNTKYTIVKNFFNVPGLERICPKVSKDVQKNSCEWSSKTEPSYDPYFRDVRLIIRGNNSLGQSEENFTIDGYAIVIPNNPEILNVTNVTSTSISIEWAAPKMKSLDKYSYFPLKYEIWISKILYNASKFLKYDVGEVKSNRSSYTIKSLIPHISYNVSIRCRSAYTEREDMWSTFDSVVVKTESDLPYEPPEVIPEAYELHSFKEYRSVTLFWKAVPQIYQNGEHFHYHIKYTQDASSEPSKFLSINSTIPFAEVGKLLRNSSYYFYIHSANEKGISQGSELFYIAPEDEIPPPPKDVKVITQHSGHYNLSWNPPNDVDNFTYTVLWCSSLKYWVSRCDNSIEWIDKNITENNIVLHLTDTKTNFQFAVVSKAGGESSGMQWASCIVPRNGGLNKIKSLHVDQINSTTLKVIWYLDCPAEETFVGKYEITYCVIQGSNKCKMVEVKPDEKNFLLTHLHPFSNYSIKIRSINHEDKASEDSDAVYQSTLPGAPSGPPIHVQVHLQSKNTLSVSWMPPPEPNGIITKYVISYNGSKGSIEVGADKRELIFTDSELKPYSIYAVQIQACVDDLCSGKSEPFMIQTEVDEPGMMKPPIIEEENSTHFKVSWFAPTDANGPIDFYVIHWHEERQNATSELDNKLEVRGANSVILDVKCPSLGDADVKYLFYVRAANKKNETNLLGPLSNSTQAIACRIPAGVGMFVGLIVGAAICAALVLVIIYRFTLWMRLKIHQVKSITIRLPEGLEGPETNPLNNYECFKNGLNGNLQTSNRERHSYVIDENKNRHGSGSSQFSNSSAEELIFKTGKCTKFGRKPSGDSSGCSSMSSSLTPRVHLSSDSGTESDFAIPPSPDSAINELSLLNSHKNPLPILMEVHDSLAVEKSSFQHSQSPEKILPQHKNPSGDVILDPPYSKFGISGNCSSSTAWRVNPLAFYSCNLANSEPSVFDAQSSKMSEGVLPPYSKVGLAKSSGVIGMSAVKENGYSKFGFPTPQKRFSIPPPNVNPITMVMLENPDRREWPAIKAILDKNCTQSKKIKMGNISPPSNDLDDDCGYIKVGRGNVCSLKPTNGYVPFNDLRSQMNQCPAPVSINANDQIKNGLQDPPADRDQIEFPYVSGWPLFSSGEESRNEDVPEVQFNVPFLSHTSDSPSMEGGLYNTDNYGFSIPYPENSMELLSTVPSESDIKYNSDSPTLSYNESSLENNSFLQEEENSVTISDVLYPNVSTTLEESPNGQIPNSKTQTYAVHNEIIVTPMTLRNGYVPFNALTDTVCERSQNQLPNVSDRRGSKTIHPNGTCVKVDDYFTPNKGDTRLLSEDSLPKTVVSPSQKDSLKNSENYIKNGNGYANLSLKYILKPLPKMESEVCEV